MAKYDETDGVWRTIGGRRVFIKNGQSLSEAMKESGKFNKGKKANVKIKQGNPIENMANDRIKEKENTLANDKAMLEAMKRKGLNEVNGWKKEDFENRIKKNEEYLKQAKEQETKGSEKSNTIKLSDGTELDSKKTYSYTENGITRQVTNLEHDTSYGNRDEIHWQEVNDKGEISKTVHTSSTNEFLKNIDNKGNSNEKFGVDYFKERGVDIRDEEKGNISNIAKLNEEMLGNKYKGKGLTPSLVYSSGRKIDIANNENGGKTATIWKDGKIERKTILPNNVTGDKVKDYFDDYLPQLDKMSKASGGGNQITNSLRQRAYNKYLKEHPGSQMSFEDFLKKQ